jgi:alkylation response protein AidB-like acyl-CoA dehydrogenase
MASRQGNKIINPEKSERELILATVREFAKKTIAPLCEEADEKQIMPQEIIEGCKELGLFGLEIPEEYGGNPVDTATLSAIIEELSKVSASCGVMIAVHNSVCAFPIARFGTEAQKKKYLPLLASGKMIGSFGLTEPAAGSDVSAIQTTALKKNADTYIINGRKVFITNGQISQLMVMLAKTNPNAGLNGTTAFIVEKSMPGMVVGRKENKMGMRMSDTTEILFEQMEVSKNQILGSENSGHKVIFETLNQSRIGIAAQAVGIASAALEEAIHYATERQQFGRPIAEHQGLQFMLAEMAAQLYAAKLAVDDASHRKDQGLSFIRESSMAKLLASQAAVEITRKAVQIHGGYGFIKDYKVERFYRDAKVTEIYEGTSEIQKIIIAKDLLRENKTS